MLQYAVTVALIYEEIKWNPEKVSNIKPYINKHNWKGINYPSKLDDWKTFEKNNLTIVYLYINICILTSRLHICIYLFCILKKKKYV